MAVIPAAVHSGSEIGFGLTLLTAALIVENRGSGKMNPDYLTRQQRLMLTSDLSRIVVRISRLEACSAIRAPILISRLSPCISLPSPAHFLTFPPALPHCGGGDGRFSFVR